MSSLLSLAWLLLVLPLAKSASLISHVIINKPNTQLTSDAKDFVNAKSHACKRETVLARAQASTKITVKENKEK